MTDEIDRLEALLREAFPGPWRVAREHEILGAGPLDLIARDAVPEDARAIAALGSVWPELLATLRKQHTALQAAVSAGPNVITVRQGAWNEARDAEVALRARIREVLGEADRG